MDRKNPSRPEPRTLAERFAQGMDAGKRAGKQRTSDLELEKQRENPAPSCIESTRSMLEHMISYKPHSVNAANDNGQLKTIQQIVNESIEMANRALQEEFLEAELKEKGKLSCLIEKISRSMALIVLEKIIHKELPRTDRTSKKIKTKRMEEYKNKTIKIDESINSETLEMTTLEILEKFIQEICFYLDEIIGPTATAQTIEGSVDIYISLDFEESDYAEIEKILPEGVSLRDVIKIFIETIGNNYLSLREEKEKEV